MRNLLIVIGLLASTLAGCDGKPTSPTAQVAAASSPNPASQAQPAVVVLPVDVNSSPQDVVLAFLNGMRDGNSGVTGALLTRGAQEETVKHNWPVQPPGAPSATYQLGHAQFADPSQTIVQVPCVWSEPDGESGMVKFEVVWSLRREEQGW